MTCDSADELIMVDSDCRMIFVEGRRSEVAEAMGMIVGLDELGTEQELYTDCSPWCLVATNLATENPHKPVPGEQM